MFFHVAHNIGNKGAGSHIAIGGDIEDGLSEHAAVGPFRRHLKMRHCQILQGPDLCALLGIQDLIVIISQEHKGVGSTQGHALADTSPLQRARVEDAQRRLKECRRAILDRDFSSLTSIIELDCNLMHAVMHTSTPPLMYWHPETLRVLTAVTEWRTEGYEVCYTIDAGPNVHCICTDKHADTIEERLRHLSGVVEVLRAQPGDSARVI